MNGRSGVCAHGPLYPPPKGDAYMTDYQIDTMLWLHSAATRALSDARLLVVAVTKSIKGI